MKKIIITFFASIITLLSFGQANTYFHDRIDTTIFAVTDTVGHGANNYYATNLTPDFNVRQYVNGFTVNLFFKKGNTGSATLTLITKTGTLSSKTIRKSAGQVLVSGDIPDSTAVILDYYNGSFRIAGIGVTASSSSWLLTGNAGTTAGTNFLGTTDAQDVVFKRNGSEAMRIYSSDKFIGIGTATPIYDLDITKAAAGAVGIQVANTTTSGVSNLVLGDGTNYSFLQRYGTTYGTAALRRALDIYTLDAGDIRFGTTNTERMRILSTGNVGIATTAPVSALQVNGLTTIGDAASAATSLLTVITNAGSNQVLIQSDITSQIKLSGTSSQAFVLTNGYNGSWFEIMSGTLATSYFQLNTNGNCGIGNATTAPSARLHLKGSGSTSASYWFKADNSSGIPMLYGRDDGVITATSRFETTQGTDVASSSTITLTYTGNVFELTGTTAVDFITATDWQEGSEITLIANENVTINDDAGGGNIRLAGNANFAMTADDVLTLIYSSTTAGGIIWREKSRSVN